MARTGGSQPAVDYSAVPPDQLFAACAHQGDAAAWGEFLRRFQPVIARSVIRVVNRYTAPSTSLVDDLVQETYLKICANDCRLLKTFTPQQPESTFAYLKVVAASVAYDHFKTRHAAKRAPEANSESVANEATHSITTENPSGSLTQIERGVLIDQIDRKLGALVSAEELQRARLVFWLYYRTGFTASAIASLPALRLTTKGVESLLLRLTRLVRDSLGDCASRGAREKEFGERSRSSEGAT